MAGQDSLADGYLLVAVQRARKERNSFRAGNVAVNRSEEHFEGVRKAFHVTRRIIHQAGGTAEGRSSANRGLIR